MVHILGKDVGETGFGLMGMPFNIFTSSVTNTLQDSRGVPQLQFQSSKPSQP